MARSTTHTDDFMSCLLNDDMVCGCLFRVLVLITPARTTEPVKPVLLRKATAVCVLLDSRVRNVKMVRETGGLVKTGAETNGPRKREPQQTREYNDQNHGYASAL